jgi:alkane 1-monooxygenase
LMTMIAMFPMLFRRVMNPRVHKWREMYYPEITDWTDYNKATNPMPR